MGNTFNWDHNIDLLRDTAELIKQHPFYKNPNGIKTVCPGIFLNNALYGKNLDHFDVDNDDSKHPEWIIGILNRMYEKYPIDFVEKIKKANESEFN